MNVFHCCVPKTASQWIRRILSDPEIETISGLKFYVFEDRNESDPGIKEWNDKSVVSSFPENTIISPLYIDFYSFQSIPKNPSYKAFFIMRDPRDLVVSWYFSVRYSHALVGNIGEMRQSFSEMSLSEGLVQSIKLWSSLGLFDSLRSWKDASSVDPNVALFKFEELTSLDNRAMFESLFEHCSISLPTKTLENILAKNSFQNLAKRTVGTEDKSAHFRKGVVGDWLNYFDDDICSVFKDVTGDLVECLGYDDDKVIYLSNKVAALELQFRKVFQGELSSNNSVLQIYQALSENADLRCKLGVLGRDIKHLSEENHVLKNQRKRQQEKARRKNQKMGEKIKKLQEKMKGMRADAKGDRRKLRKIDRERQVLKAEINEIKSGRFWQLKEKLLCWKRM